MKTYVYYFVEWEGGEWKTVPELGCYPSLEQAEKSLNEMKADNPALSDDRYSIRGMEFKLCI